MIRPKHNELEQTITAGPPERAEDISLTTYRVFIEGPDPLRDPWPENVPLTFRARTEPPGYEAEVTWMAATKYGSCDPAMGEGPELTVVFQDTFGDQNRQWLGVKADQAVLAQDQKCVGEDCDEDGVPNDADNCVVRANPLQVDIDNDGVGDLCDNCPTVMNPDQADANRDGGGDACVPPLEITLFGDPFIPDPGIAPELLEPELPHPLMEGVVHPVLQLESALMEGHRERLEEAGVELLEPIAHNVFLVAVRQDRLSDALSLPFVRSLFPLTPEYRRGPEPEDGGVMADCFPFQAPQADDELPANEGELCPVVEVRFHLDVLSAVAEEVLSAVSAVVRQPGVLVGGRRVSSWQVVLFPEAIDALVELDVVESVRFGRQPVLHNDGVRAASGVDAAQAPPWCTGSGCAGNGIVLAQWDGGWVAGDTSGPAPLTGTAHSDLIARVLARDRPPLASLTGPAEPPGCVNALRCDTCDYSRHATHVAGTMIGDGASAPLLFGAAPLAGLVSYNWPRSHVELSCELEDANLNFGARLANNSWGVRSVCPSMGLYDDYSREYDTRITTAPEEAVTFSAANSQRCRFDPWVCAFTCALPVLYSAPACTPPPAGIAPPPAISEPAIPVRNRFFTLSPGAGQAAKNTLVVGAINSGAPSAPISLGRMTSFSSWGPTQDGRIKPDLVAAGAENNIRNEIHGTGSTDPDPRVTSTACTTSSPSSDDCLSVAAEYADFRGTSMADPALTGAAGLVLEQQGVSGLVPSDTPLDSDSLKALLVHTAIDLPVHFPLGGDFMSLEDCGGTGNDCWPVPAIAPGTIQDGPDYVNGWGLLDVEAALEKVDAGNPPVILRPTGCPNDVTFASLPFNSPLPLGGDPAAIGIGGCSTTEIWDWVGFIDVPAGTTQLKVTIAWDDPPSPPPAAGSTAPLLIHDLDLVLSPSVAFNPTGPYYYSWFLDPACPYLEAVPVVAGSWGPNIYSDKRNNVEQVVIDNPTPGQWKVVVNAPGLAMPPQPFGIMISMPPSIP